MAASRAHQLTPPACVQARAEALETFILAAKEEPKRQRARAEAAERPGAAAAAAPPRHPLGRGRRELARSGQRLARRAAPATPPRGTHPAGSWSGPGRTGAVSRSHVGIQHGEVSFFGGGGTKRA